MSQSRYITWKKGKPNPKKLLSVIECFLSGVGNVVYRHDSKDFLICLPGIPKNPLHDLEPREWTEWQLATGRWIEVDIGHDGVDVLTRRQDDYVQSLAAGLAEVFQRYWGK
jgi:hypothetical protein